MTHGDHLRNETNMCQRTKVNIVERKTEDIYGNPLTFSTITHSHLDNCKEYVISKETFNFKRWLILMTIFCTLAFYCEFYNTNANFLGIFLLLLCIVLIFKFHLKVKQESLLVIASLGLQLTTTFVTGRKASHFIFHHEIYDVVINEGIFMQRIIFYLAVLIRDIKHPPKMSSITPLFQGQVVIVMSESLDTSVVCSPCTKLKKNTSENHADGTQNKPSTSQTEPCAKPNALCSICQRGYTKFYNLYKHMRKCHPNDSNALPSKLIKEKKYECNACIKSFTKKCSLSRHKTKVHPTDVSQQLEDATLLLNSRKHICDICEKKMSNNYNLKIHKQTIHGIFHSTFSKSLKCSICKSGFPSKELFIDHLAKIHDIEITVESLEIKSKEDFEEWKFKMEKETTSKYIRKRKYMTKNGLLTHLYSCHRIGRYIKSGSGKRRTKIGGTNKIEHYCPSSIFVQAKSFGKLFPAQIKFISTHVGHKCEIRKSGLFNKKNKKIAGQILSGVPMKSTLTNVAEDSSPTKHISENEVERMEISPLQIVLPTVREKKKSTIIEEFVKEKKKKIQEETRSIVLEFLGQLDKYSSPEQCAEINKTITMLKHKCETMATKDTALLPS